MSRVLTCSLLAAILTTFLTAPALGQEPSHKPGGYHSPEIHKDQSWSHVFNATGVSHYHCHPHPFMQGAIEVKEGASTTPVRIEIRGFKFLPEKVVVGPGTNVTWTNRDASFHTVDESLSAPASAAGGGNSPLPGLPWVLALVVAGALFLRRSKL